MQKIEYTETLIKQKEIGGGYILETFRLDPPQCREQLNLNSMFGLQEEVIRIKSKKDSICQK